MEIRTDLALERREMAADNCQGVTSETLSVGTARITRIMVTDSVGAQCVGKPVGSYVTIEVPPFSDESASDDERRSAITVELTRILPKEGPILIAGLGNADITPDALGPKTVESILATRHIGEELSHSLGLGALRSVSVISPGVLGKTGIETVEIIKGVVREVSPAAVIVIDALASRRLSRLGCTVQISDTGISPGSGVGNARKEISQSTLGVPVIAMGVPTVVDATTLAKDLLHGEEQQEDITQNGQGMMVTPKEIDTVIDHAADLVALSINCALHPHLSPEVLMALV
ncbi:MAG: GPR endopeptidase [Clostridia bacterium]|nr:GPR endopeptidase [Clostridia bacterium]